MSMPDEPPKDRAALFSRLEVIAVLAITLVVRGGIFWAEFDNLKEDPDGYRALAEKVLAEGTYGTGYRPGVVVTYNASVRKSHRILVPYIAPSAYRPPLYALVLTHCINSRLGTELAIAVTHVVLSVGTVWLVLVVGGRLGLGRYSLFAGLLVALDPILLHHSTLVMTETLATFLAAVALFCLVRASEVPSAWNAGLAGGSLALASLCRPVFLVPLGAAFVVVLFLRGSWMLRLSRGVAYLMVAGTVLAPWVVRNYRQLGRPIVATTHGGYTLRLANNPSFYEYLRHARWGSTWPGEAPDRQPANNMIRITFSSEIDTDRQHYREAFQAIRDEPGMFAYACLIRVGRLWQLVPHRVDAEESTSRRLLRYAVGVWYVVVFALAAVGMWALGRRLWRPPWVWAVVICLSFTLVHAVYWSNMRMRAPLVPAVALAAAAGAAWLRARQQRQKSLPEKNLSAATKG